MYRSQLNWGKTVKVNDSTFLIGVDVLDDVTFPMQDTLLSLKNLVVVKAYKANKSQWKYSLVTFVPEESINGYSGIIISKLLTTSKERIDCYDNGRLIVNSQKIQQKFASTLGKRASSGCTGVYVNGYLQKVVCPGKTDDFTEDGIDEIYIIFFDNNFSWL